MAFRDRVPPAIASRPAPPPSGGEIPNALCARIVEPRLPAVILATKSATRRCGPGASFRREDGVALERAGHPIGIFAMPANKASACPGGDGSISARGNPIMEASGRGLGDVLT
jgi:hypothetical protein